MELVLEGGTDVEEVGDTRREYEQCDDDSDADTIGYGFSSRLGLIEMWTIEDGILLPESHDDREYSISDYRCCHEEEDELEGEGHEERD